MPNTQPISAEFSALLTMFEAGYDTALEIERLRREHNEQVPSKLFLFGSGVNVVLGIYAFFGLAGPLFGIAQSPPLWTHILAGVAALIGTLWLHRRENALRARLENEYAIRKTEYYLDEFEATLKDLRSVEGEFTEDGV